MRKRRKTEYENDNVERWMVSYADFVTLLFCFFTAMYAISNVDTSKLGKFVDSMRSAFHVSEPNGNAFSLIDGVQVVVLANAEMEASIRDLLGSLVDEPESGVFVRRENRGIVISVRDKLFFESGSADLKDSSREVLEKVNNVISKFPNTLRIEGHTDNIPISNGEFPSNWELSAGRAINVAKYFINTHNIQPGRITTTGYAEFKPLVSNDTPEGRAKNRRVDIVLLNEEENRKEPL